MLSRIIRFSIKNKLIVLLLTLFIVFFGIYALTQISIGAVPDVTNNQVQVITTSQNLSTQDIEQFITYPIELEMANLPGVVEIRSISKFGLSVVTIVFEDDMGTYLPRQLIAEKIKSASEKIPEGFGTPKMGPITTGLGAWTWNAAANFSNCTSYAVEFINTETGCANYMYFCGRSTGSCSQTTLPVITAPVNASDISVSAATMRSSPAASRSS